GCARYRDQLAVRTLIDDLQTDHYCRVDQQHEMVERMGPIKECNRSPASQIVGTNMAARRSSHRNSNLQRDSWACIYPLMTLVFIYVPVPKGSKFSISAQTAIDICFWAPTSPA